jgi:hypothetical protein
VRIDCAPPCTRGVLPSRFAASSPSSHASHSSHAPLEWAAASHAVLALSRAAFERLAMLRMWPRPKLPPVRAMTEMWKRAPCEKGGVRVILPCVDAHTIRVGLINGGLEVREATRGEAPTRDKPQQLCPQTILTPYTRTYQGHRSSLVLACPLATCLGLAFAPGCERSQKLAGILLAHLNGASDVRPSATPPTSIEDGRNQTAAQHHLHHRHHHREQWASAPPRGACYVQDSVSKVHGGTYRTAATYQRMFGAGDEAFSERTGCQDFASARSRPPPSNPEGRALS